MRGGDALSTLLLNHILPGDVSTADLAPGSKVIAIGGAELEVREAKDGLVVGGVGMTDRVDVRVDNGVVHVVDDVIFPFEAQGGMMSQKPVRPRLESDYTSTLHKWSLDVVLMT